MSDTQWRTIAADLESQIVSGCLTPGTRLPSGDRIARERGVNRNTAHRAIEELQRQGLVVRRQGSGTVVADRETEVSAPCRVALLVDGYSPDHNFPSGDLLRGIGDRIGEDGALIIADSKHDHELEGRLLRKLSKEADGILLFATGRERPSSTLVHLLAEGYPVVALDRTPKGVTIDAVATDNRAESRRAVATMIERGHRRIGFLSFYRPDYDSVMDRYAGYRDALEADGIEVSEELVRWLPAGSDRTPAVFNGIVRDALFALRHGDAGITALFCVEDGIGCAAVLAAERLGLALPDDLEIATFSDWHPMTLRTPWNVHRIVQKKYEMGYAAAGLLLDRIASPQNGVKTERVDADLVLADAGLQESLVSMTL